MSTTEIHVTSSVRVTTELDPTIDIEVRYGRRPARARIERLVETLETDDRYRLHYYGYLHNADGSLGKRPYKEEWGTPHPDVVALAHGEAALSAAFAPATFDEGGLA